MTNITEQFNALAEKFTAEVNRLLASSGREARLSTHPTEPFDASVVKVYFEGDRDGNTFAICHPTDEYKRVKRADGSRVRARMWRYSYENQTGTHNTRSFVGMLRTLDGHGRKVSRVEMFTRSGMTTTTVG